MLNPNMPGCEVCGVRLKRQARRFCSRVCRSVVFRGERHQSSKPHANCAICGKRTKRTTTRFCSLACRGKARRDNAAPNWRGGRYFSPTGYITIARDGKRVFEHRAIMEAHIGRPLETTEHVHHRDGNRTNNAIDNLEIIERLDHIRLHKKNGWSTNFARCIDCGTTERRHAGRGRCHNCAERIRNRQHASR